MHHRVYGPWSPTSQISQYNTAVKPCKPSQGNRQPKHEQKRRPAERPGAASYHWSAVNTPTNRQRKQPRMVT